MNDAQFEALWNGLVEKKYEQPAMRGSNEAVPRRVR
jgi:hypothetical protein